MASSSSEHCVDSGYAEPRRRARNGNLYTFDEFVQYYSMVLGSREAGEREWASAEKVATFYVVICDSSHVAELAETGSVTMCRNVGGELICEVEGGFAGLEVAQQIRTYMPAIRERLQLISEHGDLLWSEPKAPMREARNGQLYTFDEFVDYYGLEAGEEEWRKAYTLEKLREIDWFHSSWGTGSKLCNEVTLNPPRNFST